jgi:hypothetical protein
MTCPSPKGNIHQAPRQNATIIEGYLKHAWVARIYVSETVGSRFVPWAHMGTLCM